MPAPDYARLAYEAYAANQPWHVSPDGTRGRSVLMPWEMLPQGLRDAWVTAVEAVLHALRPEDAY